VAFTHPLLRNTVLRQVPFGELRALRSEAARILRATGASDDQVAEQLLAAPAPSEPWAVAVLRDTARGALGRGAPRTAVAHLTRALSEPVAEETRASLLADLGRAEAHVDLDAAIRHFSAVRQQDAVAREMAELLAATGRHQAAVELVPAKADATCAGPALHSAELQFDGEATAGAAAELLDRLPRPVPKDGVDDGRYLSLLATRTAWAGRSRARAVALAKQSLAILPVTPETMRPMLRAVQVLAQAGHIEDAHERCDALVGHAERWGHEPWLATARSLRGLVAHRLGRMPDAVEDARAGLDTLIGCGAPRRRGTAVELLARLVEILVDLGDCEQAADLLELSELCGEVPATWAGTALLLARGRLRVAAGHPADGLRDLLAAGARLPSWNVANPAVASWRSEAALALLATGEVTEAGRRAAETVERARRWGAPGPLGAALRTLGVVVGGARGLTALEESVSVLRRSAARGELARSLAEYGTALSRARRSAPARRALRDALDLAQECGCAELARSSRIELSACGGRPPRSAHAQGVATLTAAELRAATLAAKGKSNRELAEILLVGQRTVEIHLTNAYRKLGIEGRAQLAAVLDGRAR
jgi:DNA-binding CsgD family transcriptional regulator